MTVFLKFIGLPILLSIGVFMASHSEISLTDKQSVAEVEAMLGQDFSGKKPNFNIKGVSPEVGYDIIHFGFSDRKGQNSSSQQSKHFVCTSCHNVVKEDPNLSVSDPEARLDYAIENGLPVLQGTTLYGAVNRKTYYNGDYDKKYGDLVKPARNDIREAIQLCAVECAQGRRLNDFEVESILAYLWEIDLKIGDLNLSPTEKSEIESMSKDRTELLESLSSKYLSGSPATFSPPPVDRKKGYDLVGDSKRGEAFYDKSCLHCHKNGKYSFMHLDKTSMSRNFMEKHVDRYTNYSIYQVSRWGVPSYAGRRSYMPQYTQERMSDQQLADLIAYFES